MSRYIIAKEIIVKSKRCLYESPRKRFVTECFFQIFRWVLSILFLVSLFYYGVNLQFIMIVCVLSFADTVILPISRAIIQKETNYKRLLKRSISLFLVISIILFINTIFAYFFMRSNPPFLSGICVLIGSTFTLFISLYYLLILKSLIANEEMLILYRTSKIAFYEYYIGRFLRTLASPFLLPLIYDAILEENLKRTLVLEVQKSSEQITKVFNLG